jgi:hypothetical protein
VKRSTHERGQEFKQNFSWRAWRLWSTRHRLQEILKSNLKQLNVKEWYRILSYSLGSIFYQRIYSFIPV